SPGARVFPEAECAAPVVGRSGCSSWRLACCPPKRSARASSSSAPASTSRLRRCISRPCGPIRPTSRRSSGSSASCPRSIVWGSSCRRPSAFGIELAELSQLSGDWEGAAREWAAALPDAPAQLPNAASALAEAPDAQREPIARLLTAGTPPPLTRRLAGELLLGWGEAQRAWAVFEPSVATPSAEAAFALRRFADLAGARSAPDAR